MSSWHAKFKVVDKDRPDFDALDGFRHTKSADTTWLPGTGLSRNHPASHLFDPANSEFHHIDPSLPHDYLDPSKKTTSKSLYKLFINAIVPRPIAFVSTQNAKGDRNLAPFSYFQPVGQKPPIVSFAVNSPEPGKLKDTVKNIKETKRFVVNLVCEPYAEAADYTSIDSPSDVSEWKLSGLTPVPNTYWGGDKGGPPRVGESPFSLECELYQDIDIHDDSGVLTQSMILGRVRMIHVRKDLLNSDYTIDPTKLLPLSRLGGQSYGRLVRGFELPRPVWEDLKDTPAVLKTLHSKDEGDKERPQHKPSRSSTASDGQPSRPLSHPPTSSRQLLDRKGMHADHWHAGQQEEPGRGEERGEGADWLSPFRKEEPSLSERVELQAQA